MAVSEYVYDSDVESQPTMDMNLCMACHKPSVNALYGVTLCHKHYDEFSKLEQLYKYASKAVGPDYAEKSLAPSSNREVTGLKDDKQKPQIFKGVLSLFPRAIEAVAEVSEYGSRKYSWDNWKHVEDGIERYTDALARHLVKEAGGELTDAETELLHASSVAWNSLARLELIINKMGNN